MIKINVYVVTWQKLKFSFTILTIESPSCAFGEYGLPKPILDRLNAAINRAIQSQAFKERFGTIGDEPAGGTPEEFGTLIRVELAKWRDVVKRSGAKFD